MDELIRYHFILLKVKDVSSPMPSLAAVSYLNTLPLVWGFLNGPQQNQAAVSFYPPSECALRVGQGSVDAGLIPVVEAARQGLQILADVGIACRGAVRSILLVSKVDFGKIRRLAVDQYSRSSVMLCRVILREMYAADPELLPMEPSLAPMLEAADACLIIGDPALRLDPASLAYQTLDLGSAWWSMKSTCGQKRRHDRSGLKRRATTCCTGSFMSWARTSALASPNISGLPGRSKRWEPRSYRHDDSPRSNGSIPER
jgi:hypothetical protein